MVKIIKTGCLILAKILCGLSCLYAHDWFLIRKIRLCQNVQWYLGPNLQIHFSARVQHYLKFVRVVAVSVLRAATTIISSWTCRIIRSCSDKVLVGEVLINLIWQNSLSGQILQTASSQGQKRLDGARGNNQLWRHYVPTWRSFESIYAVEESTCDIGGTFRRPPQWFGFPQWFGTRVNASPFPPLYASASSVVLHCLLQNPALQRFLFYWFYHAELKSINTSLYPSEIRRNVHVQYIGNRAILIVRFEKEFCVKKLCRISWSTWII